jgi:preprotein translocase subunit SecY
MLTALLNVFKIPELRNKVLFTLALLAVYRVGFWVPLPGVNQEVMKKTMQQAAAEGTAASRLMGYVNIFSGGSLSQSTIFGLGIMPYITAAIIFQLLATAIPTLKKLQEEGPTGRQKIQEWTRYATVGLCLFQAFMWLTYINRSGFVYSNWAANPLWWPMCSIALTAGTIFMMWLGEQIDRYGIGNGVSLIIMAGILSRMPHAMFWVVENSPIRQLRVTQWILDTAESTAEPQMGWLGVILLLAGFVAVVAGSVLLTVAQRRITVQQAKHTRGRRVYGGQRSYLPLRINHSGVMPIIFASSLMIFPSVIFSGLAEQASAGGATSWWATATTWLGQSFTIGEFPYVICELVLIYFFAYFWITVQFSPEDMSKQLREHGSFIPGLRPGPRTAEYLETVMERITFVGASFLAVIAVMPSVINKSMRIDYSVTQFLGGTGLLIVVSVALDFVQRVEANLLMRNYAGFLGGGEDGKGPRIRGPR